MVERALEAPLRPGWARPEALFAFLDELRGAGYRVDLRDYLAVQDLLLAMLATREPLTDPARFARLLGPVVCCSAEEQATFTRRFVEWARKGSAPGDKPSPAPPEPEGTLRAWMKGRAAVLIVTALFGSGGGVAAAVHTARQVVPSAKANPVATGGGLSAFLRLMLLFPKAIVRDWLLWGTAAGTLALIALWGLWWRRRAQMFLEQRAAEGNPQVDVLTVRAGQELPDESPALSQAARELRRRIPRGVGDLDVARTVERTMAGGGWPTPVFRPQLTTPEHLVLVDRARPGDHQARLAGELCQKLRAWQVAITVQYFDGDPQICFAEKTGKAAALKDVLAQPYARVIVLADLSVLFDTTTGEPMPWTQLLAGFRERGLLTPEPFDLWRRIPPVLREWKVFPSTAEGVLDLARSLALDAGRRPPPRPAAVAFPPQPRALSEWPRRWLERDAPPATEVDETIEELRVHLGQAAFLWLSALAVYPAIEWNLTVCLGGALRANGAPLFSWPSLAALSRLPWLRHAYMPLWFRSELVSRLGEIEERVIRDTLTGVLASAIDPTMGPSFSLALAREQPSAAAALARAVAGRFRDRRPEGAAQDHVFMRFMSGKRLTLRVPDAVRAMLLARRGSDTPWTVVIANYAAFALGCAFLTDLQDGLWATTGPNPIAFLAVAIVLGATATTTIRSSHARGGLLVFSAFSLAWLLVRTFGLPMPVPVPLIAAVILAALGLAAPIVWAAGRVGRLANFFGFASLAVLPPLGPLSGPVELALAAVVFATAARSKPYTVDAGSMLWGPALKTPLAPARDWWLLAALFVAQSTGVLTAHASAAVTQLSVATLLLTLVVVPVALRSIRLADDQERAHSGLLAPIVIAASSLATAAAIVFQPELASAPIAIRWLPAALVPIGRAVLLARASAATSRPELGMALGMVAMCMGWAFLAPHDPGSDFYVTLTWTAVVAQVVAALLMMPGRPKRTSAPVALSRRGLLVQTVYSIPAIVAGIFFIGTTAMLVADGRGLGFDGATIVGGLLLAWSLTMVIFPLVACVSIAGASALVSPWIGLGVLALAVWWTVGAARLVRELRSAGAEVYWQGLLIPFFATYFRTVIVPREMGKAKQRRGVAKARRSRWRYVFLWGSALSADLNDLAAQEAEIALGAPGAQPQTRGSQTATGQSSGE
jgi:hypothetical protein